MILTPSQLKTLCEEYHLSPSKQYGQNYLISDAPIEKMIVAGELTTTDTVVEIGPGFGILTLSLAPVVKRVVAFEIEKKLQPYWDKTLAGQSNIEMVWGNVLKEFSKFNDQLSTYSVIANIPYQITSDTLRMLLEAKHKPKKIILMVQKEVAERICARPGDMSLLAVSVQYYGQPRIVTTVTRGSFWPSPAVDSAVIAIDVAGGQSTDDAGEEAAFFTIVRAGFSHKRKQLWNNLAHGLHLPPERVKGVLRSVVHNDRIRAEDVGMDEWRAIVNDLRPITP